MAYRQDQGRLARMAAFWSLAILIFYGCVSLRQELAGFYPIQLGQRLWEGGRIPIVGIDVTPAFLIASVTLLAAMTLLFRWTESPKIADSLIDTESELRKVSWPTLPEAIQSSVVVMITVVVLMVILAGADYLLGRVVSRLLIG
ncbi:MAG: preprotein translocase SecE subunit [Candidatus Paceibacteria bacterium]|jgi:preprotein translocase SecE subunit